MALGWGWFLPLALVNVVLTATAYALEASWVAYVLPVVLVLSGFFVAWIRGAGGGRGNALEPRREMS
jgi:hypothetical protein